MKAEINQKDLKNYKAALNRLESKTRRLESQHPFSCAGDYQVLVKKNLLSQKYFAGYPRYNPRYAKWKAVTMRMGSAFWYLFGDLFRAITVFKVGRKDWFSGVPSYVYDRGGKSWFTPGPDSPGFASDRVGKPKKIAMYGHIGEKRRPLFEPTADEYAKKGFVKQGSRSLKLMGKQWR
jgi:hypothetical protein